MIPASRQSVLGRMVAVLLAGNVATNATSPELFDLVSNGPRSTRINVVLLAEGYREGERGKFQQDGLRVITALLAAEPLRSYARFYNAYGLFVASEESGSDHPSSGILRNTYFNSTYESYGITRLLTIPPNDSNRRYADGEGKVVALLREHVPDYDMAAIVVNDPQYGGSGGSILVVSTDPLSGQIAVHEQGHSFARLGDEYSDPFPGYPDVEEPNTTRETRREFLKWRSWVESSTPVPTPSESVFARKVGLFLGAHYHANDWYRPKLNCKMRSLSAPFCEVCSETIDLAIHRVLGTVDRLEPATNLPVSVSVFGSARFRIHPVLPTNGTASVAWRLDGVPLASQLPLELELAGSTLSRSAQRLSATFRLESPWVRTDSSAVLSGEVSWTLERDQARPPLLSAYWESGEVALAWPSTAAAYGLESASSTVVGEWREVGVIPLLEGSHYRVRLPALALQRYYRLRRP